MVAREIMVMDHNEALRLLRGGLKGVTEWNRRRESGEEIPLLRGVNLGGADLRGANLGGANLGGANLGGGADLRGADLSRADLDRANLHGANLIEARLGGARLYGACLYGADLIEAGLGGADLSRADLFAAHLGGADLRGANLRGVDLRGANLRGADLREANLEEAACLATIFADVDLSEVKGLDAIVHGGPSTVGIDTLVCSRGKIPEAFLRGCGVSDALIASLPSLIGAMSPISFYSCFISYSPKDEAFANRLYSRMVQEKLRVWYALKDMGGGRKSIDQIDHAIRAHDKLLLVLSEASMASDWVKHEVIKAVEREKTEKRQVLIPLSLVSVQTIQEWTAFDSDLGRDLAKVVRDDHIADFSKWEVCDSFEAGFANLLRDLKAEDSTAK